jgi:hypothetical protein
MYENQGGLCACCKVSDLKSGTARWVQPDRAEDGTVMALICLRCSRLLQALARADIPTEILMTYWYERPTRKVTGIWNGVRARARARMEQV